MVIRRHLISPCSPNYFFRVNSWSGITVAKDMKIMEVVHIFARVFLEMLFKFILPHMEKVHLTTFWPAVNIVF